ncbi:DUF3617 domain-containing protein [Sphingopyxis witflariensis]|nr:DUF3617 domain-containing protein [Sphingopyxis witflariensis]
MKKFMTIAALGVVLAVAGCGKADGPVKREAGNWKNDVKLVKFEVPGMPDEMKAGMKQMMEGASGLDQCLSQEQVDKEDLAAELSKAQAGGGECKWSKKDVAGGKIDIAGTCTAQGQTIDMKMVGTMEAKKSDVTTTIKGKAPTGGDMEMVIQNVATHTGPCKAGAAPVAG